MESDTLKEKLNEFLRDKFLKMSDLDTDLYELGRYDAFNEIADYVNDTETG